MGFFLNKYYFKTKREYYLENRSRWPSSLGRIDKNKDMGVREENISHCICILI